MLMLPLTTMVDTMAVATDMDTDIPVLTDTDIPVTLARGLLMPNPKLMPMLPLMPTMDTTAVDTDTVDTALDTMVDTVDTMAMDTDMVTDTDITVKLLLILQIFKAIFPLL